MSKIISIGTALPAYKHEQIDIFHFMKNIYTQTGEEERKLKFLYNHSGIETRYSCIRDYSLPQGEWSFYPPNRNKFPDIVSRMNLYEAHALPLAVKAIQNCLNQVSQNTQVTHLITVSCTGLSAPGLDIALVNALNFATHINRTSVNFMGCYAAIHALKQANAICNADPDATVLIVCVELCTLHFQEENSIDNITSSMLFADGAAAALIVPNQTKGKGVKLNSFYSEIVNRGKEDMSWQLSPNGFVMKLSSLVPVLIKEDIPVLIENALLHAKMQQKDISHWCIHPGGKRILEVIQNQLSLTDSDLNSSYDILKKFGNMSSATILFVLQSMLHSRGSVMGMAFGPGLTLETFIGQFTD